MNDEFELTRRTTQSARLPLGSFAVALALISCLASATVGHADTLTVLNTLDKGKGSLRDQITGARNGDTIVFHPRLAGQTITLTSDELQIAKNLDIEGPGASLLTISGNDSYRVFDIAEGGAIYNSNG